MPEKPTPEQDEKTGRFVSGNIGGGRPKGSRNKLGEAFLNDMLADWEEHGIQTIQNVRTEKPDVYLKVVASILPKDLNVNVNNMDDYNDDELIQRIRDIDAAIRPFLAAQGEADAGEGIATPTTH